jgi:hypothetical protein
MPYIKQAQRQLVQPLSGYEASTPGELNYQITSLVVAYLDKRGISYTALNEVIGVLECAKLELYRRAVAPYEDQKCEENGDVYV